MTYGGLDREQDKTKKASDHLGGGLEWDRETLAEVQ